MQQDAPNTANHYVYLLLCANGTIYVGQTHDLSARLGCHRAGRGARHTASTKHFELIYREGPMPSPLPVGKRDAASPPVPH